MYRSVSHRRFDGNDYLVGGVEMTVAKIVVVIRDILKWMKNGEIRLLIRNGDVKYINVLHEIKPDDWDANKF